MQPNTQDRGLLIFQASGNGDVLAILFFFAMAIQIIMWEGGGTSTHDKQLYILFAQFFLLSSLLFLSFPAPCGF